MKEEDKDKIKDLFGNQEVPEELKKEVFASLNSLRLFGNIFDLFTDKFARTEGALFGSTEPSSNMEEESEKPSNEEKQKPNTDQD